MKEGAVGDRSPEEHEAMTVKLLDETPLRKRCFSS